MILSDTLKHLKKIAWFAPGFLLYAAYPPMCEVVDAMFALAPLMWLSRQGVAKTSARRWFMSGMFFWAATLSWMPAIIKNDGPWPLVVLGWAGLSAYCASYFALYGLLSARYWAWAHGTLWRRLMGILVVEPVLWCGLEIVRSRFLGGFSWNQLGVVMVNSGFGSPAAVGGVYLCSALVILINGSVAGIIERIVAGVRRRFGRRFDADATNPWRSCETLLVFAAVWGVFFWSRTAARPETARESLTVALVQRNFPCCFKEQEEDPQEIYLENLYGRCVNARPDLVVLPESAMSEFGAVDGRGGLEFARWSLDEFLRPKREAAAGVDGPRVSRAALLAGGARVKGGRLYNSAALYQAAQTAAERPVYAPLQIYDKVHLVPFGEFIPLDKYIPSLQKLAPVGSCTPGEPKLLTLGEVPFGVAICFEDTDAALVREFAAQGARFLCFITNDSWFSNSAEALAHAWQATARAVETGLPVVRVGNSGVTGVISPDGEKRWLGREGLPLVDEQGVGIERISPPIVVGKDGDRLVTPYVRFGDAPIFILFALLIGGMILVKYRNHVHEKRRRVSL